MKEIICLHIGQAGVQLGSGIWELLCAEHGIETSGICLNNNDDINSLGMDRFFYETPESQIVPRALLVDLEPTVIDEVKSGQYKQLFSNDSLISGFEDSASIFSRGYLSFGRFFINDILSKLNRQIEQCDTPQSFCFTNSSGGGTGSGLLSLIVEEMEEFSKIMKMDICFHPSFPISPIIVEPYNSVLTLHYTMDNTDVSILTDNVALYSLASRHLQQVRMNYHSINRITAQVLSSVTAATRFDGQSTTISEYLHNLVPYPRIHFPICSLSPICCPQKQLHHPCTTYSITKDSLSRDFQMIRCIPMEGTFMSCCLIYRGDIQPGEVYKTIDRLKCCDRMQFVDWSPTGIKVTICHRPSTVIAKSGMSSTSRSLMMLCNNSSIVDVLLQNTFRFHILFKKRAFVHWFVAEGMEEAEFKDSLDNVACLVKDYEECIYPTKLLPNAVPSHASRISDGEMFKEISSTKSSKTPSITSLEPTKQSIVEEKPVLDSDQLHNNSSNPFKDFKWKSNLVQEDLSSECLSPSFQSITKTPSLYNACNTDELGRLDHNMLSSSA